MTDLPLLFTLTHTASSLQTEASRALLHTRLQLEPTASERNGTEAGFQERHFFTLPNNFVSTPSQWVTLRYPEVETLRRGRGWHSGDGTLPLSHWRAGRYGLALLTMTKLLPTPCPGDFALKWGRWPKVTFSLTVRAQDLYKVKEASSRRWGLGSSQLRQCPMFLLPPMKGSMGICLYKDSHP